MSTPVEFYAIPPDHRSRIRQAISETEASGHRLTQQRVLTRLTTTQIPPTVIRQVCRWYKQGSLPQEDWAATPVNLPAAPGLPIVEAIRNARSFEDLVEANKIVIEEMAHDRISSAQGAVYKSLLAEMRQAMTKQLAEEPDAVEDAIYLVGQQAADLAVVYEQIVSEEARLSILAFAQQTLEKDLEENPNRDTALA